MASAQPLSSPSRARPRARRFARRARARAPCGRPGHVTHRPSQSQRAVAVRAARESPLASFWWKAPLGAAGAAAPFPPAAPAAAAMDYGEGEGAPPLQGQGPAAATAAALGPGRVSKWQRPLCYAQDGAPSPTSSSSSPAATAGLGELWRRPAAGGLRGRRALPGGGAGGRGVRAGGALRGATRPGGAGRAGGEGAVAGGGRGQSRGELGESSLRGSCQEPGDPTGERAASWCGSLSLPSSSC